VGVHFPFSIEPIEGSRLKIPARQKQKITKKSIDFDLEFPKKDRLILVGGVD